MDYIGPFDTVSMEATFGEAAFDQLANANPDVGQEGAIPPMELCKHPVAEILEVIKSAGLNPSKNDLTQLRQAIEAKIASVFSNQITVGQVLAHNRVYPHVTTANNRLTVIDNEDGTLTLAADQTWVHRGLIPRSSNDFSVENRTVTIPPDSVGHMKWRWNDGSPEVFFGDLADSGYNPSDLVDGDTAFDAGFDEVFIARIEREGSGAPEIRPIRNAALLTARGHVHVPNDDMMTYEDNVLSPDNIEIFETVELDWARRAEPVWKSLLDVRLHTNNDSLDRREGNYGVRRLSRYEIAVFMQSQMPFDGMVIGWGARA